MVWYFSLIPGDELPQFHINHIDKLEHFASYALLMSWFAQLYLVSRSRMAWLIGFVLMGGLLELLQGLTPTRSPEWLDMLADSGGALVAYLFAHYSDSRWLLNLERLISSITTR